MLGTNGTEIEDSVARAPGWMDDVKWTHDGPWGWLTLVSPQVEGIPRYIEPTERGDININFETLKSYILSSDHTAIQRFGVYDYRISGENRKGLAVNGIKTSFGSLENGDFIVFGGCPNEKVGSSMVVNGRGRSSFASELLWREHVYENASNYCVYKFEASRIEIGDDLINENWEETPMVPIETPYHLLKKKKIEESSRFMVFQRQCAHLLECPICRLVFVDPIGLECGHAFCRDCLGKDLECFSCRKKIVGAPRPSTQLAMLADLYSRTDMSQSKAKKRNERVVDNKMRRDTSLTKFKSKNPHIQLDIRDKWSPEDRALFKQTSENCTGECKRYYLDVIGLTDAFIDNCSDERVEIAINNLGIAPLYTMTQQTGDKQERKIDIGLTRVRLARFRSSFDTLFI